ncbi:MAG: PQQ-dependent sugar dehydrogenase, partial [Pirellulaceae bacterium]
FTSEPNSGKSDFTVGGGPGGMFDHQAVIREWTVDPLADVIVGDPAVISRVLMRIDEPQFNHDGGMVAFGPDRMLYISLGDGGGGHDAGMGHGPDGNGQDPTNVLGTILRIDPLGKNSANGQYGVPANNPFVFGPEVDEIFAWGLRNPFRFSFDTDPATGKISHGTTGQLFVADVGQRNIEEVDIVLPGDNLGWRLKEGSFFFDHVTGNVSNTPFPGIPIPPTFNPVDPVFEYDHDEGRTVIGGFVYRGKEIPELVGKYVFGDFTAGGFFTPAGRLFVGNLATGLIEELRIGFDSSPLGLYIKGFGQDANGELYLLGGTNLGPFRDATGQGFGVVMRLRSASPGGRPNWRGEGFGLTEPDPGNPGIDCQVFAGRSSFPDQYTATGCHEVDADSNLVGSAVFEALNGHKLHVTYTGFVFDRDDKDFPLGFNAQLTADGGTGRFEEAKGTAIMTGALSGSPGVWFFEFAGTFHPRG